MSNGVTDLAALDSLDAHSLSAPDGLFVMWPEDKHWFSENGFLEALDAVSPTMSALI